MSKRTSLSVIEKLHLITPILEERKSIHSFSEETGYSWESLSAWIFRYKRDGLKGLEESKTWKSYSAKFKEKAKENGLTHIKFNTNLVLKKRQIVSIFVPVLITWNKAMPKHRVWKGDDGWGKKGRKVSCFYFQIRITYLF